MDETSVNITMRKERVWQDRQNPVRCPENSTRFRNITIMGAIGNALKKPCFMLAKEPCHNTKETSSQNKRDLQHRNRGANTIAKEA